MSEVETETITEITTEEVYLPDFIAYLAEGKTHGGAPFWLNPQEVVLLKTASVQSFVGVAEPDAIIKQTSPSLSKSVSPEPAYEKSPSSEFEITEQP